ncbi:hypothetical protein [Paenibacillus solani]|nr:hypothetical protein [Paenibacillus solani]
MTKPNRTILQAYGWNAVTRRQNKNSGNLPRKNDRGRKGAYRQLMYDE